MNAASTTIIDGRHNDTRVKTTYAEYGSVADFLASPELLARALQQAQPEVYGSGFKFLISLLNYCGDSRALPQGQFVHTHMIKSSIDQNIILQNLLLHMYGKCDAIDDAYVLFANMHHHDHHSWNFILTIRAHNPGWDLNLNLLDQFKIEGTLVNKHVLSTMITYCANKGDLLMGKRIHSCLIDTEYEILEGIGSALISLYGKCDTLKDAFSVFRRILEKNVVSWSSIITCCTLHNYGEDAIQLWCRMQLEAVLPNRATFLGIFDACANETALRRGKQLHCCLPDDLLDVESKVLNCLIHMYGKCDDMENALKVFEQLQEPSVVSWTAIMAGYSQHGHNKQAFEIFDEMQRHGVMPNKVSYVCILDAINGQHELEKGKQIHACIKHRGIEFDLVVGTALINMYGKCGSPGDALEIYNMMPNKNDISRNAMLTAYSRNNCGKEAFELFSLMLQKGESVNNITYINMLSVCAYEGALIEGKWMHDQVVRNNYCKDLVVGNSLLHMYSKCGQLNAAINIFERIPNRSVVTWSSMIPAFAYNRHSQEILPMLHRMKREGVHPNEVTFKAILSACSHSGLVDVAHSCLKAMGEIFGLKAGVEHYGCVIDLFARAGRVEEVEKMISSMPIQPSLLSWVMLLSACSKEADLQRGEWVANQILEMYPDCYMAYVILSNMYVSSGRDSDADMLLSRIKDKGLMQECSYIEVGGIVKEFSCNINSYLQEEEVYAELQRLERLAAVHHAFEVPTHAGQVLVPRQVMGLIRQVDCGKDTVCSHTERLAMAFGFLNVEYKDSLFIAKATQTCHECHAFFKSISRICNREIIISECGSLHHMLDGACSCAK
ncbi:hypothetical protein KP509_38G050100 [Ceratopteris richardii]|nr:hypothetical protein KP509_38G050100 [Ceratopteris richardii]